MKAGLGWALTQSVRGSPGREQDGTARKPGSWRLSPLHDSPQSQQPRVFAVSRRPRGTSRRGGSSRRAPPPRCLRPAPGSPHRPRAARGLRASVCQQSNVAGRAVAAGGLAPEPTRVSVCRRLLPGHRAPLLACAQSRLETPEPPPSSADAPSRGPGSAPWAPAPPTVSFLVPLLPSPVRR